MCWQNNFLESVGPGLLPGTTISKWFSVLQTSRFGINAKRIPRAFFISGVSVLNSIASRIEKLIFQRKIVRQKIESPIFVIGCWRSGTTFLQNILSNDSRFGFPNLYQCLFPTHFLYTEPILKKLIGKLVPQTRPQDNVHLAMDLPSEEEIAMCVLTGKSHLIGDTMTMAQTSSYSDYITLNDLPNREIERWKKNYIYFLRKLTVRHQKPLILKSPAHTGRIRLLLEMFPDAKFIMMHRHPHAVMRSGINWLKNTRRFWSLQKSDNRDIEDIFARNYGLVMNSYFEERDLIPESNLVEVGFESLEQDPISQLEAVYQKLGIEDFESVRKGFEEYLASHQNYNKNAIKVISSELRDKIHDACPTVFAEWNYSRHQESIERPSVSLGASRVAA